MSEIRFYHLQNQSLDQALPALIAKAYSGGHKIIVRVADENTGEKLNELLWAFREDAFIPHGTAKDGNAKKQPIWISPDNENPNDANVLILTAHHDDADLEGFDLICDIFDGRDESAVTAARTRWKTHKDSDHDITYWQQTANGWEKKA